MIFNVMDLLLLSAIGWIVLLTVLLAKANAKNKAKE